MSEIQITKRTDRIRDGLKQSDFPEPEPIMSSADAGRLAEMVLSSWQSAERSQALVVAETMLKEFPDQEPPEAFWDSASSAAFRDFFVWGHDHDFGQGVIRKGAMSTRHIEIATEGFRLGMLPSSLKGKKVLDIGCWSGGDLLLLAGLGADVVAVEEHPIAAKAARRLANLVGADVMVHETSLYNDKPEWAGRFDYVYCAGVIYHVTDPLLFARIIFAYLKPGGSVYLETKSCNIAGSACSYSGTLEKGWNWYAPNELAFGRWLVDAGFDAESVRIYRRSNGRLLAFASKTNCRPLRETAGFSRPGSWLEGRV